MRCHLALGLMVCGTLGIAVSSAAPAAPSTLPATQRTAIPATAPAGVFHAGALPGTAPATRPAVVKPGMEPLLSMAEFHALFDQGKYPELLKQLPRVLILRGKAAEPYNRYELTMLKFETHMRMKASQPALATLADAQSLVDDEKKINYCKAVTLLIRKSKNFAYQPTPLKKEKPPTLDIIEPENRQKALKALLNDEIAAVMPKVEKALDGQSLSGIAEALASLQGFDTVQSAANGGDETTHLVSDLRTRGNALMAKTVQRLTRRADDIVKSANDLQRQIFRIPTATGWSEEVRYRKRGLTADDWRDLNDIVKASDQLIPNAKGLAKATGGKVKEVEDLITAAEDLKRKADRALKANYNE